MTDHLADTLLPNTTNTFVLPQQGIDWDDFRKRLGLNESELEAAQNLEIKKEEYLEVLFFQGNKRSILKVIPDPLTYWTATSDPSDKEKIEETALRYPDLSTMAVLKKLSSSRELVKNR